MQPGSFVIIYLIEPSERLWGRLISLTQAGVTFRGLDVNQLETFKFQFKREERLVYPQTIFIPMRRVQKIDLDEAFDSVPSVIESVVAVSGVDAEEILIVQ